jgi:3-methylfumaryl-CoA hydratase
MPIDIDHLRSWIGREEVAEDVITPIPVAALAATLGRPRCPARDQTETTMLPS